MTCFIPVFLNRGSEDAVTYFICVFWIAREGCVPYFVLVSEWGVWGGALTYFPAFPSPLSSRCWMLQWGRCSRWMLYRLINKHCSTATLRCSHIDAVCVSALTCFLSLFQWERGVFVRWETASMKFSCLTDLFNGLILWIEDVWFTNYFCNGRWFLHGQKIGS